VDGWSTIGLVLVIAIFWWVTHVPPIYATSKRSQPKSVPKPLAKWTTGQVNCGMPTNGNPKRTRSIQEVATDVREAKAVVATHVVAERLRRCSPECKVHTIIAGLVRDRKALKKHGYNQPF
jgi:hypothetical protein